MENVTVYINGNRDRLEGFKNLHGSLFSYLIPHLKYCPPSSIKHTLTSVYSIIQALDRNAYSKFHKKTWKWLQGAMEKGDFKTVTRFIVNAHLASSGMPLLHGFGLAAATKTLGRTKAAGAPYSDPERTSIYEIEPHTKWPMCLVLKKQKYVRRAFVKPKMVRRR